VAFRLLDSDALRGPLAHGTTSLVLLVSQSIYDDIVRRYCRPARPARRSSPAAD
jgi:hypothetical protein